MWTEGAGGSGGSGRDQGASLYGLVGTLDGWLAMGMSGVDPTEGAFGDPSDDLGAIWTTSDRIDWAPAAIERPGTAISQVVRVAHGWLAVGNDHGRCPRCVARAVLV